MTFLLHKQSTSIKKLNALLIKAYHLIKTGRYEKAINYYDKAMELNPNEADTWYGKGSALDMLGRNKDGEKLP
jgi:Flp pilus assembly protein TadD